MATVDFLARGGDQYPYRGARFTRLGVTYQQALVNFIREGLDGRITAAAYPEGGQGRITTGQPIHAGTTVRTSRQSLCRTRVPDAETAGRYRTLGSNSHVPSRVARGTTGGGAQQTPKAAPQ